MKKVLRFLLILVIILLVGYLILCATSPSSMDVVRSNTINGSKAVVWNQVVDLQNYFENYSPWKENDHTIKSTITGPSGQVGQKASWVSDKSGSGEMTISAIDGDTMKYNMHFITPMEGKAEGWTAVEKTEDGVKVTCGYHQENSFFWRGVSALFGETMMKTMFDRQLELLKDYVESGKAAPAYDIKEVTYPATTMAIVRKTVKMDQMHSFYGAAYQELGNAAGDMIVGNACSITYKWDEENGEADIAAAFPVSGDVKGVTMLNIPESKGYMTQYVGPYSGLSDAYMALHKYATAHGQENPLMLEEYVTMPPAEPDSNKYVTNIYFLNQ